MDSIYWNLDQALAWIRWHDLDIVRNLENQNHGNISYGTYVWYPPESNTDYTIDKRAALLYELQQGSVSSRGCKDKEGNRQPIDAETWNDLYIVASPNQPSFARSNYETGSSWNQITIKKDELIEALQPENEKIHPQRPELHRQIHEAAKRHCEIHKPDTSHGWKAKIHESLKAHKDFNNFSKETIKKYARDALNEYERDNKRDE